jgi:hypothetical protein
MDMTSVKVLLNQGSPSFMVFTWHCIRSSLDSFGRVLKFNLTEKISWELIEVGDFRENVSEFLLHLNSETFEFLLRGQYFDALPDDRKDIHRFYLFEFVLRMMETVIADHL